MIVLTGLETFCHFCSNPNLDSKVMFERENTRKEVCNAFLQKWKQTSECHLNYSKYQITISQQHLLWKKKDDL